MTKEEIEKEADDYAEKHAFRVPYDGSNKFYDDVDFKASKEGYLAGAKPREKQIKLLGERCNQLLRDKGDLTDQLAKAKELLRFWVNDFYDNFNHSNKYEERHKAIIETEQFLKE